MNRVAFLLLLGCLLPSPAVADDPRAAADALAKSAVMLVKDGSYDEAIRLFEKAYALDPEPVLLFNVGRTYEKLNEHRKAREYYEKYLVVEKDAEGARVGRERLEAVTALIPGSLILAIEPAGATVTLDGRELGTTPLPGPVDVVPGRHVVEARAPGLSRFSTSVSVAAASTATVEATLLEAPAAESEEEGVAAAAAPPGFPWHWVALGTGAALVAGGGVMTYMAHSDRVEVTDAKKQSGVITGLTQPEAADLRDSANTKTTVSLVLYGAGGAALAAGALLYILSDSEPAASAVIVPVDGGGMASFVRTF